jgi:branched-chain amino acid transport system ATP-binding protein
MSLLRVEQVHTYYEQIHALQGVSLVAEQGQITTLIGSNGSGKSTVLKSICGISPIRQGRILFRDGDIGNLLPHQIVQAGIVYVPEGRRPFENMTVHENLEMGAYLRREVRAIKRDIDYVFARFPRLIERRNQFAGTLSGGEQQMLAIGRSFMARPRLMLLDEPSMGLAPLLVREIFQAITALNREQEITILLVEQNAQMALAIAARAYVLQGGQVVQAASAEALRNDPRIIAAYLGGRQ